MSTVASKLPTGVWNADPIHSSASFTVRHMGAGKFRAGFTEVSGSYDGGKPELRGEARVDSIDISLPDFRNHVLSPDFFDAASHPAITFVSQELVPGEDNTVTVSGDLTIKGVTKRVSAIGSYSEPGPDIQGTVRWGLEVETEIDRREYGLDWNAELPNGKQAVEWTVTLEVALEFAQTDGGAA